MYDFPMNRDLLRKPKTSRWTGGLAIFSAWFLFWPVGIFLTYKRASIDKKAAMTIGIILIIIGLLYLFAGLNYTSGGVTEYDLANRGVLIIIGLIHVFIGIYTRRSAKKFLAYIALVVDEEYTSISNIADSMSTTYEVALRHVKRLIKDGYFNGCYLNEDAGEIELPMRNPKPNDIEINEIRMVECKSCGAHNKVVVGTEGLCEYCRSIINA